LRGFIIIDLGFGDAGKGLLTDFLVRRTGAGLVIRYNGGAQAGHNVVAPDGIHHTFSQFGSGTFVPGVRTFLSRHVVIHPSALLVEHKALESKGIGDALRRLRISEDARVITPYHQAANRLRELARGPDRHGSCGIGLGETVKDALDFPDDAIRAKDLGDRNLLREKLQRVRQRKREAATELASSRREDPRTAAELALFDNPYAPEAWIASAAQLAESGRVIPDSDLSDWAGDTPAIIFEGAQGVLLDEEYGFHPYTTWSRCTAANAGEIVAGSFPGMRMEKIGVLRSYAVRHGPGPLPTETVAPAPAVSEHNTAGEWQGPVRYGWFDAMLARYALEAVGGVDRLVITHMDAPPRLGTWRVCGSYSMRGGPDGLPDEWVESNGTRTRLPIIPPRSIDSRVQLTQALLRAAPVLESCDADEKSVRRTIGEHLGRTVDAVSRGPRASDVEMFADFAEKYLTG
jgi:adenylosuccinate synthase